MPVALSMVPSLGCRCAAPPDAVQAQSSSISRDFHDPGSGDLCLGYPLMQHVCSQKAKIPTFSCTEPKAKTTWFLCCKIPENCKIEYLGK